MYYPNMVPGVFRQRPNRFIAYVEIDGKMQTVHVKNTGRCRELLVPGAKVWCQRANNPNRKTQFDLIAVQKGSRLINMDAQAPNGVVQEWLASGGFGPVEHLCPETVHGDSRFDFSFTKDGVPCLMEVKGCTLETDGVCAFPDAPTARGTKHLRGLAQAVGEGYACFMLLVIQMEDVAYFHPNDDTDPQFGAAIREAAQAGVHILAMDCQVTPNSMTLNKPVPVKL